MKQALPTLGLAIGAVFVAWQVAAPVVGRADVKVAPSPNVVGVPALPLPAPTTAASVSPAAPVPQPPLRLLEGVDPKLLLQKAFEAVDGYGSVAAKLRQRGDIFGTSMIGSGTYLQGSTAGHRLRLEMTFQVGDRKASIQQIADGEYLWIRRELVSAPTLWRISIDRVLAIQDQALPHQPFRNGFVLGLGGLPRLLIGLQRCVAFDAVAETTLGQMPVVVLRGKWRKESLGHLLPDQLEKIRAGEEPDLTKLTEQLPDEFWVFLGRDDLFPYRFEYRRTAASQEVKHGETPMLKTLMALEFYEVQINESIDITLFTYERGENDFQDETNEFIYRHNVWPN